MSGPGALVVIAAMTEFYALIGAGWLMWRLTLRLIRRLRRH